MILQTTGSMCINISIFKTCFVSQSVGIIVSNLYFKKICYLERGANQFNKPPIKGNILLMLVL